MTKGNGKPCRKCGTSKWSDWGNCQECSRIRSSKWYKINKKRAIDSRLEYRRGKGKESGKRSTAKYRKTQKGQEAMRRGNQSQYSKNAKRRYREQNRDKINKKMREYKKNNKDKVRRDWHIRRTRKTKAGGSYTAYEWKQLVNQQNGRCLACGKKTKLTVDHVIPVSKGGTSSIENIQGLCGKCNNEKGTRSTDYRKGNMVIRWIQNKLF